jgi:hypothetical protein
MHAGSLRIFGIIVLESAHFRAPHDCKKVRHRGCRRATREPGSNGCERRQVHRPRRLGFARHLAHWPIALRRGDR